MSAGCRLSRKVVHAAAQIECFRPLFQSWKDHSPGFRRRGRSRIYGHHNLWTWKYSLDRWEIGPSWIAYSLRPAAGCSDINRLVLPSAARR